MRKRAANSRPCTQRALLALLLALVCCDRAAAQLAPPSVIGFTPAQAAAGSTVTMTFTGANFVPRLLKLMFSPAQGITVSGVRVVSSMQVTAQLQIAADAQPGSRQVILLDADHSLQISSLFTITAAAQGNCVPGMAAAFCGPAPPAAPVLREFTPVQGTQGTSVAVTFTGANFTAPAAVQFIPASGITVQSTTVSNANQIQARIVIAPNAALSSRGVVLVVGEKKQLTAANTFTVVSGASSAPAQPMQILRVVPNQIAAGSQNVDLTLEGVNFVPGTQVTFTVGAGIPAAVFANGPARYIDSTEMHVTVSALPSALPGGRDIHLQPPGAPIHMFGAANQARPPPVVGKGMLDILAPKPSGLPSVLKIAPISLQKFTQGVIRLDAPLGAATQSDQYVTYAVPLLDDNAVFKWHEQNPGLADYYELRVYAKDGKTLLATQKITGVKTLALGAPGGFITVVPTYYRPDPAFLKTVLEPTRRLIFNGGQLGGLGKQASPPPGNNNPDAGAAPDQLNGELSQGDLQWEVAGFHTYNANGVATQPPARQVSGFSTPQNQNASTAQNSSGGSVDLQVEISDRWPLMAPLPPTGLACGGTGITSGNLQVQNLSKTTNDPNSYVGDKWSLGGTIDLSRSPYQPDYTPQTAVPPGSNCGNECLVKDVTQVQFSNVYVDWGDGTVTPLAAPPVSSTLTNWDPSQPLALPENATSIMQHAYQSAGSFTVRVYQLSNEDLQHVSVGTVSSSVDGPTTPFLQTALLGKMTAQGTVSGSGITISGVQSGFQQLLGQGNSGSSASQAAGDAYMLYCQPLNITVPEDLAADGPLHLKGIADPDFGAYDISAFKTPVLHSLSGVSLSEKQNSPANLAPPLAQADAHAGMKLESAADRPILNGAPAQPAPAAICSSCDDGVDATSSLQYYGTGQVRVTWTVDGVQSQQTLSLPPSTPRKNLTRQGYTTVQIGEMAITFPTPEPPIIISTSNPIDSPELPVQPLGNHSVTVVADVLPQPTIPNLSNAVNKALGSLMPASLTAGPASGSGENNGASLPTGPSVAEAQSLLQTLAAPAGSNLPPLKVGLLSPSNQSVSGLGAVQYVNGPLQAAVNQLSGAIPDQHVASNAKAYEVVASDPKTPCKFLFPANHGEEFEITGLQNHVTQQGGTYNGTGNLIVHLANAGSQGYDAYPPIPVKISNWSVPDGLHVQTGSIDVAPDLTLAASIPGLKGSIQRIAGQAGGELDATLDVALSDDTLRLPGEQPVAWNGVQAELHANGDWMKDGLKLPTTLIGWSAFTMQSNAVRLDLSHHDGDAANSVYCGPLSGADWVGVRFPSLAITPYTMNLVASASLQPTVTDWGITANGLCGSLATGSFSASLGAGSVSFASINATAFDGNFSAQYNGMDVYVPWLDAHLKGNATLQSGGGKQASISFPLNSPPVTKSYGNFGFTASNLQFMQQQNLGWVVQANTHFVFSAENATFAAFDQVFNFGMDGRGYFAQGAPTKDVSLGGSSHLGQTPVDLASVHLTAPSSGSQVLAALFNTSVHLSEVMAAATAQVNYSIDKNATAYTTSGPSFAPFTIDVPYPSGQPSADAKIHPVYSGASGSGGSGGTEISGSVDLSELGGPPITGEFRLGYQGGHDYWLTRISYTLGPTGLPLISVPPVMNLYRVQGGIGHNFPISAFEDTGSLKAEQPVMDNSFLFMAGIRVGMPDQFTYTLDGDLTIKAGGQDSGARLDFHAWLLKMADSGNGDFQGYLQYAGGNFDARLWGHLNLLDGIASVDLGNSAGNAAVDLHFGPSGPWHIDAGKQQGPRISGTLLEASANMYLMLSGAGLAIGGGESINLNVGDDSVASAYVHGDVDFGLAITPQPHISGDLSASVSAGVCVDSVCVSADVSAQIHAEALPLEVEANASIGLPWPLGSVSFSVHM